MKIRKPVTTLFKPRSNFCRQSGIGRNVEQNRACRPYKAPRPADDDDRSDETHEGQAGEPPLPEDSYYMLGYDQQIVAIVPRSGDRPSRPYA